MVRAFCAVVGALLAVGQATAFFGSPSAFMTGAMSAGLRTPGATSALGREARTYRRLSTAKSGAASTVMMPIGVPKVCAVTTAVGKIYGSLQFTHVAAVSAIQSAYHCCCGLAKAFVGRVRLLALSKAGARQG